MRRFFLLLFFMEQIALDQAKSLVTRQLVGNLSGLSIEKACVSILFLSPYKLTSDIITDSIWHFQHDQ